MRTHALIVCCTLLFGPACIGQESTHKTFPTKEEIELVVTQAERAFEQYKQSVELEVELPAAQMDKTALDRDKQIVEMSGELIDGLRKKPEVFNGLGGLLLLTTLDDASRNAALCSSSGMGDIGGELLKPKPDATAGYRILSIAQKCSDVSVHLYTVSESVNALFVRTVEAQQELNEQTTEMLTKCGTVLKNAIPKSNKAN